MKNYEEELKKEIFKITRQTLEIDKYNNIYRYQRKNISDEMEESFSKYIANNLNNKKLHYKIAASLTIEFTDEFVKKK